MAPAKSDTTPQTGALAAVFYCANGAHVRLSGSVRNSLAASPPGTASACEFIKSEGANHKFNMEVVTATSTEKFTFNFDDTSPDYLRKVFNTNATLLNSNVNSTTKSYFLGESYDQYVRQILVTGGG